ncbi:hypothetical protein [Pseudomonas sp. FEN]|uniref:hypothetical protein n=1 Tax=Pseudomonas sp. FEN TaxID=2767468 RepID=UPI0019C7A7E1|nr:hypothetical protein [Pseudomonas sp. FEN]CAD5199609.1 hypothetical protein [Pseudomonas sp. FEN]
MLESYEQGKLDVALVLRHDNRRQDGEVIGAARFSWMAAQDFELLPGEPLPLAIQPAPCGMRSMVMAALQTQNRPGKRSLSAAEFWPLARPSRPASE